MVKLLNPWDKKPEQGVLFCTACDGEKQVRYVRNGHLVAIRCPLCKGTGIRNFKTAIKSEV